MTTQDDRCPWCGSAVSRVKFEEITARIRQQEQVKLAQREKEIRKGFEVQLDEERKKAALGQKAQSQKEIEGLKAKVTKLEASDTKLRKELKEQAEKDTKKQLDDQRLLLQAEQQKLIQKEQAGFGREREKWQKKIAALERQLQHKSSHELGEGAVLDLFEALKGEYREDGITRVKNGEPGADIHQQVIYKGEVCGLIIFDSKNREAWQRIFATKLREDQLAAKADHSILSTTAFPSGKKELCIEDDVLVVNPARVCQVVAILRNALIKMHVRGLTMKEREDKMEQLYKLISSDEYTERLAEATKLSKQVLELDEDEVSAHRSVWKKRGRLMTRLQKVLREIDTEVSCIMEGGERRSGVDDEPATGEPSELFDLQKGA